MPKSITDLLQRRSDLSTFLVHLTRRFRGGEARDNLLSILETHTVEARSVYGMGKRLARLDEETKKSQLVVCYTETPLEHVWMMCEDIENRPGRFAPYGLAVTKTWARRHSVNPVWYLDMTRGHDWLTGPVDDLVDLARKGYANRIASDGSLESLAAKDSQAAKIAPFIEQMGKPVSIRKEWWWEREWRHVGDQIILWQDLVAVFAPEEDHEPLMIDVRERLQALSRATGDIDEINLLDPRWGLERMIASLARVPASDVGPFPF